MSLLEEIKKLRELEQKAKKDYVENGNWYRYNAEKLAPAMLDVLWMIREGDAGELELIYHILERGFIDPTAMRGYRRADQRGMLECIQRHAKMAALMEKEEREG